MRTDSKGQSLLTLDLGRLRAGEVHLRTDAADLSLPVDAEVGFSGDVDVEVTVEEMAGGARLRVRAATLAAAECFRCLEPYELPLHAAFDVVCCFGGAGGDDDIVRVDPRNPIVDLGPRVREALLLEVPMTRICRSDCAGLCPGCGADLNRETCRCRSKT
jgi:uncharacterized protein